MRFLLLNQFYPPDPAPTGWYLHGLARELVGRGHFVRVLCSRRSYDGRNSFPRGEKLDGVEVSRLPATGFGRSGFPGKIAGYASFYISLATALLFERSRPDLILSLTTPPYVGLLGKAAAARLGCRHAHWIMDLYPDVMLAHGMAHGASWPVRALGAMTRWQLRDAHLVLTLGPNMADRVAAYTQTGFSKSSARWVPLWSDSETTAHDESRSKFLRARRGWSARDPVFLYSGNMGLGHRFSEFLEAANRIGPSGPRWVFSGGGKRRREIESFARAHPSARIEMLDYVPQDQLRAHLCSADVHLASLDVAWQGLMVPSKLQASFAAARPVLFVGGRQCETAAWIDESGGGWIVAENDVAGLMQAIQQSLDPEERRRRGLAALGFARKNFNLTNNCARIAQILEGDIVPSPLNLPCSAALINT